MAEDYRSVDELHEEATLVVEGRARSVEEIEHAGVPYELVTFSVTGVLEGARPNEEVVVRQLDERVDGLPSPMLEGHEYLLFLRPFELQQGKETGQWGVVSPGQWALEGDAWVTSVESSDLGTIPSTLNRSEADRLLGPSAPT
ncbi:hypothetical protein [Actinotalea sp. C106]|uniref:hypothetical protein n=1 Tax=Actinotalea sp. C106 TaxID=2908644 RepID=UPI002028B483|nr:hypothetical protein [Actinotalea sp. C106]